MFGICTVVGLMGHLLKLKCAHSSVPSAYFSYGTNANFSISWYEIDYGAQVYPYWKCHINKLLYSKTGFIRGILRGVRYAKSLRVLFLHRRSPSWTTLVLYSRVVFIFNEPTKRYWQLSAHIKKEQGVWCHIYQAEQRCFRPVTGTQETLGSLVVQCNIHQVGSKQHQSLIGVEPIYLE
jgi:hypothetical protein